MAGPTTRFSPVPLERDSIPGPADGHGGLSGSLAVHKRSCRPSAVSREAILSLFHSSGSEITRIRHHRSADGMCRLLRLMINAGNCIGSLRNVARITASTAAIRSGTRSLITSTVWVIPRIRDNNHRSTVPTGRPVEPVNDCRSSETQNMGMVCIRHHCL